MKLSFIKISDVDVKAKATIHKTGRLGFSSNAIDYLGISEGKFIKFAFDEEEKDKETMYAQIISEDDNESLPIIKAGDYYYVNTKGLFESLGIDYKKVKVIYDLVKIEYESDQIIKMIKREIPIKKKEAAIK